MAADFLLETIQGSYSIFINYLLYPIILSLILIAISIHFYARKTLGIYKDDHDMSGKTVVITGASDGIGKVTAHDLARRNARVVIACRNLEKGNKVAEEIKSKTGNPNVIVKCLDLCSFDSVRKFAQDILDSESRLDVLINNAGATDLPKTLTQDGCDLLMQTNHFGHFLLTLLLLDLLKKSSPSRIINVSSHSHYIARFDIDDLNNKRGCITVINYSNSKLANILFTCELSKRLEGTGVTVNALHPGLVRSAFFRNVTGIMTLFMSIGLLVAGKTAEEGACTTIRLAVDPTLDKTTGRYFSDCVECIPSEMARDEALAKRLFELSEQMVGQKMT